MTSAMLKTRRTFSMLSISVLTILAIYHVAEASLVKWFLPDDPKIVRVDLDGKRIFVIQDESITRSMVFIEGYLCRMEKFINSQLPKWKNEWGIWFFSTTGHLGYKEEILEAGKSLEDWSKEIIAEFSYSQKELIYYPQIQNRKKVNAITVECK